LLVVGSVGRAALATPAEPTGPHPRMLLDAQLRAALQERAKAGRAPITGAVAMCERARTTHDFDHAGWQGEEWRQVVQACLVAWAATDDKAHATTAIAFSQALLDDLTDRGDGKAGDRAVSSDDGYGIRNRGPFTALVYDWLYDQLTPDQRAHARARWKAWLAWYADKGYRAHAPPSNYYAGYLAGSTAIAIAQAGEAGADSTALWRRVADEMWGKEMAVALADDGVLRGGDWPEGWQYGPLSVVEISFAARIARGAGIEVRGIARWLDSLLKHHVYAM
jgi:hypothetical protein